MTNCTYCNDLAYLTKDLKLKCAAARRQEKMKLLTLIHRSWSISHAH